MIKVSYQKFVQEKWKKSILGTECTEGDKTTLDAAMRIQRSVRVSTSKSLEMCL